MYTYDNIQSCLSSDTPFLLLLSVGECARGFLPISSLPA